MVQSNSSSTVHYLTRQSQHPRPFAMHASVYIRLVSPVLKMSSLKIDVSAMCKCFGVLCFHNARTFLSFQQAPKLELENPNMLASKPSSVCVKTVPAKVAPFLPTHSQNELDVPARHFWLASLFFSVHN